MDIEKVLREREARGLIISIYGHFIAFTLFFILTINLSNNEALIYFVIVLVTSIILAILLVPLKRQRWISFSGILIAIVDTLAVSILPFIWREIAGAETPSSYMLKSYTFYVICVTLICINGIALRPLFILASTTGAILIQSFILWVVVSDPATKYTDEWQATFLTDAVNLKIQYNMIAMVAIIGVVVAYITYSARKTIVRGIELEKVNSQFGRYFSPNVREELNRAKEDFFRPGGKIQEVVILFSDIRSFTAFSEEVGVENTLELLSEYQKIMVEIIFRNQGTLDKFIGDGILASFGTPKVSEKDADNAILCAIEMQKAILNFNERRKTQGKKEIQVGIGIHAGRAIVGNIGSEERLEYTVIGDTVNTASRVESLTKDLKEKILITESVKEKLKKEISFKYIGEYTLRGKKESTKIYSPQSI